MYVRKVSKKALLKTLIADCRKQLTSLVGHSAFNSKLSAWNN